ncbi:hypothetical protein [Prauserella endophytica]|uniref:Uncharacterized protein n=1 Tax=Prauserella endophytica TaxID=1592324 RepID=A0ABY2S563_9PSEU|nr:hypothetical protein [Prauserella endophytica]TKG71063.1 hypothetical protein FCN18_13140 [Prauserella endophytica]
MTSSSGLPAFARGLCDDAAVFPPGLAPLADAVPAHVRHRASAYGQLVGPLVLAEPALAKLGPLLPAGERIELSVTAPEGPAQIASALAIVSTLQADLAAFEVAVPPGMGVAEFFAALDRARAGAEHVTVYVEVPRDERRAEVIAALARRGDRAKFRTGGVRAELYPDEAELASAIAAVVAAGVPFKATAGLHHALRNTDPETGFEQHGFLNLLLATDAAVRGADEAALRGLLAERDGGAVAAGVRGLGEAGAASARRAFVSFGTCSITEPLAELVELDLVPSALASGEGVNA